MTTSVRNLESIHLFFSPHLDDAVLSCGGLLSLLGEKNAVLIVNVFSQAKEGKLSRYSKNYLHFCGFKDKNDYFKTREKEDKQAAALVRAKTSYLDLPEAIFRFQPRFLFPRFFYNSKKKLLGKIDSKDKQILTEVKRGIKEKIDEAGEKIDRIYFPLAIGGHVDHRILNQVGFEMAKEKLVAQEKIFFYQDFPYLLKSQMKKWEIKLKKKGLRVKKIHLPKEVVEKKHQAILCYRSQIKPLFGTKKNFVSQFNQFHRKSYETYWYFV